MNETRIVLAGIGGYGIHYVTSLLRREQQGEPIRLVALVDPAAGNSPVFEQVAKRPLFTDLNDCLAAQKADLVILASPIHYHAEQIRTALNHGAHVLCEKPMCATKSEALLLIEAQRLAGLQVGIGYQWSYSPAILKAKDDVLAGIYGPPQVLRTRVYWPRAQAYFDRSRWAGRLLSEDGRPVYDSVLNNATAHYLHNLLFFLGADRYDAAVPDRIEARVLRAYDIETFDTALLRMEKDGPGGTTVMALAVSHCPENLLGPELDYRFAKGRLTVHEGRLHGFVDQTKSAGSAEAAGATGTMPETGRFIDYGPIMGQDSVAEKIDALLAAVRQGSRPPCDVVTAYAQTAVVSEVHRQTEPLVLTPADFQVLQRDGSFWRMVPGLDAIMDRFVETLELPQDLPGALRRQRSGLV